jgi:hypothetical protein
MIGPRRRPAPTTSVEAIVKAQDAKKSEKKKPAKTVKEKKEAKKVKQAEKKRG